MKTSYTTYSTQLHRLAKKLGFTEKKLLDKTEALTLSYLNHNDMSSYDRVSAVVSGITATVQYEVYSGSGIHLFMPNRSFCDWLVSCVKNWDPEHGSFVKRLFNEEVGVLHFPSNSGLHSAAFYVTEEIKVICGNRSGENHKLLVVDFSSSCPWFKDYDYGWIFLSDEKFKSNVNIDITSGLDDTVSYYLLLIIGLGMYCDCFPEVVLNGPPTELKHPSQHQYDQNKTVKVSEKVLESSGSHDSPVAHFRRGHFRVLRSERFTNKRFQSVFVHETFVGGKSKTILSPEESDARKE